MKLLGDVGHVEPHFFPYGDSVCVGARQVQGLRQMYHRHKNHFGRIRWNSQVTRLKLKLGPFGYSANLEARQVHGLRRTYHRFRNHFGRTRWNSQLRWVIWNLAFLRLETVLVSVQDRCTVCAKHTISLEIILDTPDDTPRLRDSSESSFRSIWRQC